MADVAPASEQVAAGAQIGTQAPAGETAQEAWKPVVNQEGLRAGCEETGGRGRQRKEERNGTGWARSRRADVCHHIETQ